MLKKLFAISTLLLVLIVGALFVYNFLFKKPAADEEKNVPKAGEEGKVQEVDKKPAQKTEGNAVSAISEEPVYGATLSNDGRYIYFFLGSNGQLNQVDLEGKLEKVILTEPLDHIKKATWNKPKNKVLVKTETEPGRTKFLFVDLSEKKVTPLKENIDSASWSNLGDKIVYKYFDPKTKKRTVSVSDPDGKNWRDLASFDYQGVEIASVPNSSNVSFWPSANAFLETSVQKISWSGEGKKEILKGKFGADILWSPDGARAIVSSSDQKGGHKIGLFLMNSDGGELQTLMLPTFVSKCAWSADSKNIFCALPGNIPDSAILPNDWQEGKVKTIDTFWKMEVSTGKKERLVDTEKIGGSFDALSLFLSQDEKTLFFISKSDGKLYKLNF